MNDESDSISTRFNFRKIMKIYEYAEVILTTSYR